MTGDLNIAKQEAELFRTQAGTAAAKSESYDALFAAKELADAQKYEEAAKNLKKVNQDVLAEGAKEIYAEIQVKINSTVVEQLYDQGVKNFNEGKFEEAKNALTQVVEINPDHDYAQYYLARSYERLGDVANAKLHYQKVVELLPETTQRAKTAKAYLNANP